MGQSTRIRMPRARQVGEIQTHLDRHAGSEQQNQVQVGGRGGWEGKWGCGIEWKYDQAGMSLSPSHALFSYTYHILLPFPATVSPDSYALISLAGLNSPNHPCAS